MWIKIEKELLEKYHNVSIGYLLAEVCVRKTDDYVERLKSTLKDYLNQQGIHPTNFTIHPNVAIWREIYEGQFGVKAKTYRSSLEALLKRVVTGKDIWNINNVVDLYNCCSIFSLLPIGGYDFDKIFGNIELRYAREGETFKSLGENNKVETQTHHTVYADDKRVICWLWNYKDSAETCICENTKNVLFFIDSFDEGQTKIALEQLEEHLSKINCTFLEKGILNRFTPHVKIT